MTSRRDHCKAIAALDHIKCTWDKDGQEYRVTLDGLSREREEAVAYYTDDPEDAMGTACSMSKFRTEELARSGTRPEQVRAARADTIWN